MAQERNCISKGLIKSLHSNKIQDTLSDRVFFCEKDIENSENRSILSFMNYEKWLELKEAEENKEYKWHCIGLGLMALIMAGYGPVTGRFEWVEALISGFCPYLMCVWAARPHKERADSYERKYRTHTPYISVKKVNAELLALEFDPGQVTIYYNSVAGHESLTVDREFVKIKPSDTDISYVKYQLATNNNTRKQKIKFVNLYLEESMQEKLLNLVKEAG